MKYIIPGETEHEMASMFCKSSKYKLLELTITKFPDGEVHFNFPTKPSLEDFVFILMRLTPDSDGLLFQICNIALNLTRFGVKKIIAICPYLCYARSDQENSPGDVISIETVLRLFSTAGISALISVDIHSSRLDSFTPSGLKIYNVIPVSLIVDYLKNSIISFHSWQVLGTDRGSEVRVQSLAEKLNIPWACLDKQRLEDKISVSFTRQNKIASNIIIYDDIITSGWTMIKCIELAKTLGATRIIVVISHIVLPDAIPRLFELGVESVIGTNSIIGPYSKLGLSGFLLEVVQSNF